MSRPVIVLKFGSSVLSSEADLPRVVHEIYRRWRAGDAVVAVVSAFAGETDRLLNHAARHYRAGNSPALAALLATGESTSAALLALALGKAGIPATLLDPAQAGLRTRGTDPLDHRPFALDTARIHSALYEGVVVLPGFAGRDESGATTLLGRGGSDYSALFLARELRGRCVLIKDVDGLYSADPNAPASGARRYAHARWATAAAVGDGVVQVKAVRDAETHGQSFVIAACGSAHETRIGPGPDTLAEAGERRPPLRVVLLGCGTVGGGVYRRLAAQPEWFTVIGVAVRDPEKAGARGIPPQLITRNAAALSAQECDVVIELIGGLQPAEAFIRTALGAGRAVVTANKALLAAKGTELLAFAGRSGATLHYSAAVGGALPALEAVARTAPGSIVCLRGILNGTSNFILEKMAAGDDFSGALAAARAAELAEADPSLDLDGTDAAQKLALLARAAGVPLDWQTIFREGIDGLAPESIRAAKDDGGAVRLVAEAAFTAAGVSASVRPRALDHEDPLANCPGAWNALEILYYDGRREIIRGIGAGRWPTAEAVLADLDDIRAERARETTSELEAAS